MTKGFSLLEMLIVLVLVGILLGAGFMALTRFRDISELQQAQQIIVQEFNRARSDAFRLGVSQKINWTADSLTVAGENTRTVSFSASARVKLITKPGSFSYSAPYGTTSTAGSGIILELKSRSGRSAEVLVYGLRGKVFTH